MVQVQKNFMDLFLAAKKKKKKRVIKLQNSNIFF